MKRIAQNPWKRMLAIGRGGSVVITTQMGDENTAVIDIEAVLSKGHFSMGKWTEYEAICVAFAASDVLFVGMTGVHANSRDKCSFLCGIRLFSSSKTIFPHVLFVESLGEESVWELCIGVSDSMSYLVFLMENRIGVFVWKERYSDRLVCVASIPGAKRLTAGSFLWDRMLGCVVDENGSIYVLDISGCLRALEETMRQSFNVRSRKRIDENLHCLKAIQCVRGGACMKENPMAQIQIVGFRKQIEALSMRICCARWINLPNISTQWLIVASENGSLQV